MNQKTAPLGEQDFLDTAAELLSFINNSKSVFHAVENIKNMLRAAGFIELYEQSSWKLEHGRGYFVRRNGSALIAFILPHSAEYTHFILTASHSDSPSFKVKPQPEIRAENQYIKLNIEKYGGPLCAPWFDRPLSVAGRILVQDDKAFTCGKCSAEGSALYVKLVDIERDLLIIPSLAIHMNRDANEAASYNVQTDMLPVFSGTHADDFVHLVAQSAGVESEQIQDMDLFLYNRQRGCVLGAHGEFIGSPRLDNLQCAFATLKGFIAAGADTVGGAGGGEKGTCLSPHSVPVYCLFDNEEVGSSTKQGAASTFLKHSLKRINTILGGNSEDYYRALAGSFFVSADNAHAVHPNYADKADPVNRPYLNGGIVIKYNANQKYTSDALSAGIFRSVCKKAGVPIQTFVNRSDMAGGSTLGNISNNQVALNTVDIGLPQLGMHSAFETGGIKDTAYLIRAIQTLYTSTISLKDDGTWIVD